jgi:hypothetical protein
MASSGKWWLAPAYQFLQGTLGLLVTFFQIVRANNIFDLLVNFTAMEFVSQLDDVAFFLAGTVYFGSKKAKKSQAIGETFYPQAADKKKRRVTINVILLVVFFSGLLAKWGAIVSKQRSNKYLCKQLFVYSTQTELIQSGVYNLKKAKQNNKRVQYIYQKSAEETEDGPIVGFGYFDEEAACVRNVLVFFNCVLYVYILPKLLFSCMIRSRPE